jgi:hypothetical protein
MSSNWNSKEQQILKDNYNTIGAEGVRKLLFELNGWNRTLAAIYIRAQRTGIDSGAVKKIKWNEQEDRIIKEHYNRGSYYCQAVLKMEAGTERTRRAILTRARILNIQNKK